MKKLMRNDIEKIASIFKIFLKYLNQSELSKKIFKEIILEYENILHHLVYIKKKNKIYLSGGLSNFYFKYTPNKDLYFIDLHG